MPSGRSFYQGRPARYATEKKEFQRLIAELKRSRNRHTGVVDMDNAPSLSNPSQDLRLATLGVERCAVLPHDRVEAPINSTQAWSPSSWTEKRESGRRMEECCRKSRTKK